MNAAVHAGAPVHEGPINTEFPHALQPFGLQTMHELVNFEMLFNLPVVLVRSICIDIGVKTRILSGKGSNPDRRGNMKNQ